MALNPFRRGRRLATPIALAFVSLVSAVILWVAVTEAENPNRVTAFGGAIEIQAVNVPEGLAVASIRDPIVSLRISAPDSVIKKLTSSDFRAELDLGGVRQTTTEQRVIARVVGRHDVGIVEVSPAFVSVVLEPIATRQVPVNPKLIGAPPQGFTVGEAESTPAQVRISGAESLVQLVSTADADVNLTGLRVAIKQQYPLVPRDSRGADVRGLKVEPASADIKVQVLQQEVTLTLTVLPSIQGTVAEGYNLIAVTTDPPAVAVSGPLELLQAVPSLTTEPVDVSGIRADATRNVRLRLPAGLQSPRDSVSVRLRVVPARGEILLSVAPQITGLGEGLRAQVQTSTVTLRLAGDITNLRALQPSALKVTANASGLGEGIHVLTPTVSVPDNVQVVSSDPQQIVVSIQR